MQHSYIVFSCAALLTEPQYSVKPTPEIAIIASIRRQAAEHVLDSGKFGVPLRRGAVFASGFEEFGVRR